MSVKIWYGVSTFLSDKGYFMQIFECVIVHHAPD